MSVLSELEPKTVFRFFEELCAIPHGSHHTKAISDYLVKEIGYPVTDEQKAVCKQQIDSIYALLKAGADFEELAKEDIVVAVSADPGFKLPENSRVVLLPKPLYAYPVIKVLNEGGAAGDMDDQEHTEKPVFKNVRALIVDDEPMNLVVASGLFKDYNMITDTAESGQEAISK